MITVVFADSRAARSLSLSPCGRGWLARRESERAPGEGLCNQRFRLTRLAHWRSLGTLSHKGERFSPSSPHGLRPRIAFRRPRPRAISAAGKNNEVPA